VPLWFNKLDMKDYLESVYNVQTAFIRSWVVQKKTQKRIMTGGRKGPTYRPASNKKMLVHMMEPFTWPEEPEDFEPYVPSRHPSPDSKPLPLPFPFSLSIFTANKSRHKQLETRNVLAISNSPKPRNNPRANGKARSDG
jgi:hypothetical protein